MGSSHVWKFFSIGGLDQVSIDTGADLLALKELDQKLWVALSCPVKGLELDEKTLALIDSDKDGRVHVPEILAAIDWAALLLNDTGLLLKGSDTLPLSAFNTSTPEGNAALASAKRILSSLGKSASADISLADAADTVKVFAATKFNGDGVITPDSAPDDTLKAVITDIVTLTGGTLDRSGVAGIDQARIDAFYKDLAAFIDWNDQGGAPAVLTLGADTAAAAAAIATVQAKVDDFFTRTRLATFDPRSVGALNRAEADYVTLATKDLSLTATEVSSFPLSHIEAGKALSLLEAVNPAWAAALATLHQAAVTPVFGAGKTALTESDWTQLKARIAPYVAWTAAKAGGSVEKLGLDRVKALLAAGQQSALTALIVQDVGLEPEFTAVTVVEKLLRYARDFRALLNNFVNFFDFYSPDRLATFQAGTLYLDSRSTEFCVRVDAANPLAAMSKAYIAYVDCKRAGEAPIKVAACFTQGDSDYLFVGRNGLFYDRRGRDWDATITSIVENPISIREAFWSPYKKFIRMIEEQVAKRAAAADAQANSKLAATATLAANADKTVKPPEPPKKIDVGTIAALGVAVGAIGGALGAIATGLASLNYYQLPVVVLAVILAISLPSMLIAWLKLRQRNLGPLLEANGWAINGRVKINIPFGTQLTDRAQLPANARRDHNDPYEDKAAARRRKLIYVLLVVLAAAAIYVRWDYFQHQPHRYFWEDAPVQKTPPATPPPTA